jgi:hypothetical protein
MLLLSACCLLLPLLAGAAVSESVLAAAAAAAAASNNSVQRSHCRFGYDRPTRGTPPLFCTVRPYHVIVSRELYEAFVNAATTHSLHNVNCCRVVNMSTLQQQVLPARDSDGQYTCLRFVHATGLVASFAHGRFICSSCSIEPIMAAKDT